MSLRTLKNGQKEEESIIVVTMISLEDLVKANPIALFELVEKCKNPDHALFGNIGDILESSALIKDGIIHSSIKNIVLSAVSGADLDLHLVNPIDGAG